MDERGKSGRKIYSDDADAGGKPDLQAGSPDEDVYKRQLWH